MSDIRHLTLGGILLLATAAVPAASLDNPAEVEALVDGIVQSAMKNYGSPSGTVTIARHGQVILSKGYGFEEIEKQIPVDPARTLFRPGSVSKLLTWVAVMQQVEQGKVDLDVDVNTYLKTFQIAEAFDQPITLRHVMTHTTGFEDGALGYLIIDDPARALPLAEAMERYEPARVNPPGAQTAYSNYATALAGLIVENVSGQPFADYIRQHILEPLGMGNSTFVEPLPAALAEHMATSYGTEAGDFAGKPFEIITSFAPAGALSATSADMVRFAQAILNGGELDGVRILARETVDLMLTRAFSHDERLMGMALGFYESDQNGVRILGHGGDTRWFHSDLGIDQQNGIVYFVSFGSSGGSAVRFSVVSGFYDAFFPRDEAPPAPPADFAERAAKYAGAYGFWRNNFSTIEKALGLTAVVNIAPTEDGTLFISLQSDKLKQYAEVGANLFREMSPNMPLIDGLSPRQLAFQENEAGEITGLVIDGLPFMSMRKLPVWATPNFNYTLLGVSLLVFLAVLLRRGYQRRDFAALPAADRTAVSAAVYTAAANVVVVIAGAVVVSVVGEDLFGGIPLLFKLWLILPILAAVAGLYLLYRTVGVWKQRLLAGTWARVRFSTVTGCALAMCWFYWFWNILGFQYK